MPLAVLAAGLGLLWVAIEATTVITAFLVGQRRTRAAVEAAWKYVVICSTGIALALLGMFLLNFASQHAGSGAGLDLAALAAGAGGLDPGVTRIAVALLIIGFGTKAGLAPLHAWLPDAHSQAPAPVSALMSGVLLSVAFYAILRVKVIADAALGVGFARTLLGVIAIASLLVAATLLLAQRDYKRMLAYSSIEHMGLLALGAAIGGPLATAAVLLHVLGHGLAKSTLFVSAGHVLQATGTSRIDGVHGLAVRLPVLAGCVGAGRARADRVPPVQPVRQRARDRPRRVHRRPGPAHRRGVRAGARDRRRADRAHQPDAARARPRRPRRRHRAPVAAGDRRGHRGDRAGRVRRRRDQRRPAGRPAPPRRRRPDGITMTVPTLVPAPVGHRRTAAVIAPDQLPEQAEALLRNGFRVALVAGHDDGDRLRAVYLFTAVAPERRVELHVPLDREHPRVPSIARLSFTAGRFEREMRDLFGIVPDDHPLPRRLVRHFHWPRGWYPMLADAGEPPAFGDQDGPYPFRTVDGPGVYEIPAGPVHAGMIEPGHFRFSVVGETILKLKVRLWFVHRGVEKLFEGRSPEDALELAERISGDTSVGHAVAFCAAVEDARAVTIGEDAQRLRAILVEMERLYNHVTDIGALCNDVGHGILNAHAGRIREQLLRTNDELTGSRLLRGAVRPHGATLRSLPDPARLRAIAADVAEVVALAVGNAGVRDRFAGTAVLHPDQARDLGVLGYIARASGSTFDARHDHPSLCTPPPRTVHDPTGGDVLARFLVRAQEIAASVEMIATWVGELDGRRSCVSPSDGGAGPMTGSGVGIVEGWRGTTVHRVEIGRDGNLSRAKIVDPSFLNWPALPVALAATIVPDFPLANKSFGLSYAGNDL